MDTLGPRAILRGLAVTTSHFFRNLIGFLRGKPTIFTVQYPEELQKVSPAFRGMPVLVQMANGKERCVACGLCEWACPVDCITIYPAETDDGIERYPKVFDIDMSRCMFCGLCEEACPEEAIVMSQRVAIATTDWRGNVWHKRDLLVPAAELETRLTHVRRGYDRAAAVLPPVSTIENLDQRIFLRLRERFSDDVRATHAWRGDLTAEVAPTRIVEICRFLRDDAGLAFDLLVDVTAVDYLGSTPRFEIVYHLKSLTQGHRLRIKTRVPEDDPRIDSVVGVWRGADWLERETFDLYGIRFNGHPDLRRIYLYEEFEGHPLRKDYPKERRQPLVTRADLDSPQVQRQEERDRARYGRWH